MGQLRIIVTGLVGLHPVGGVAWDYLQYFIGLARLGHDVYYHEDTWSWPYDPVKKRHTDNAEYSVAYISSFIKKYAPELSSRWHYRHLSQTSYGMTAEDFRRIAGSCDLFINVSGANLLPPALNSNCIKIFLDTDPGYNQIVMDQRPAWAENVDSWIDAISRHDKYFTYAENIHDSDCIVPRLGLEWFTTRMPVVLSLWRDAPAATVSTPAAWTTIMSWNAFKGPLVYRGTEYGSKGQEFQKVIGLPHMTERHLAVAVGGITTSLTWFRRHGWDAAHRLCSNMARWKKFSELRRAGWEVMDAPGISRTPESYRRFILGSRGEISTAKHVYVAMRTGWFSCRSACYLAAGRPAILQDTGFSRFIPTGGGLFAFNSQQQAVEALEAVESDYQMHSAAARDLAAQYFDSDRVLEQLITDATASARGGVKHAS